MYEDKSMVDDYYGPLWRVYIESLDLLPLSVRADGIRDISAYSGDCVSSMHVYTAVFIYIGFITKKVTDAAYIIHWSWRSCACRFRAFITRFYTI